MLTEMLRGATVYIVTGYTDMRKGIDGLAQIVEGSVGKDESKDAELDDIEKEHFRKAKAPEMLMPRSF